MFTSDLTSLCRHEKKTVPTFFTQILERIEITGLIEEVGIYRPHANPDKIRQFMDEINEGKERNCIVTYT